MGGHCAVGYFQDCVARSRSDHDFLWDVLISETNHGQFDRFGIGWELLKAQVVFPDSAPRYRSPVRKRNSPCAFCCHRVQMMVRSGPLNVLPKEMNCAFSGITEAGRIDRIRRKVAKYFKSRSGLILFAQLALPSHVIRRRFEYQMQVVLGDLKRRV